MLQRHHLTTAVVIILALLAFCLLAHCPHGHNCACRPYLSEGPR